MDEKVINAAVPLLHMQRSTGKEATLDECIEQAKEWGARVDLVILLVRQELPLTNHERTGLYKHLVVPIVTSPNGGIYSDDHEALEALNLVAQALGQTLTVRVIERS
jgi:hypothetical protein